MIARGIAVAAKLSLPKCDFLVFPSAGQDASRIQHTRNSQFHILIRNEARYAAKHVMSLDQHGGQISILLAPLHRKSAFNFNLLGTYSAFGDLCKFDCQAKGVLLVLCIVATPHPSRIAQSC